MPSQTQRGAHRSPGSCSQYLDKSNDRISCHEVFTILSGDPQLQLSTSLLESHGANCELEFRSQLRGRKLEILLKKLVSFSVYFIEIIADISFMTYTTITIKKLHQCVEDKSTKSITKA